MPVLVIIFASTPVRLGPRSAQRRGRDFANVIWPMKERDEQQSTRPLEKIQAAAREPIGPARWAR